MTNRALILIYHEVAEGNSPLRVSPSLFEEHLDCFAESGATLLTISALGAALRSGRLPPNPVCLTFDDGFASVVDEAVPRLVERGVSATVFCVAGYLGRTNDWPSQPSWVERRPLAPAASLAELAASGFELGAHGYDHAPLAGAAPELLHRELVEAQEALEQAVAAPVASLAYPYGSLPPAKGAALVRRTYDVACTATPRRSRADDDVFLLSRVPAHHVRRSRLLGSVVAGHADAYLGLRRAAVRLRRFSRDEP